MPIIRVRALSLTQPYADWVVEGIKTLETRKYTTTYRGDFLVCSTKSAAGPGMALGIVGLYGDVRPMTKDDEAAACIELYDKAQVWPLRNPRKLRNLFPVRGMPGWFYVEAEEEAFAVAA